MSTTSTLPVLSRSSSDLKKQKYKILGKGSFGIVIRPPIIPSRAEKIPNQPSSFQVNLDSTLSTRGQRAESLQQLTRQVASLPNEFGCGIRSGAEDIHAYSEGRLCEAWSPEEYDMHEWLEIDRPAEHNYLRHVRTIYKHVLDDLYRRFVPPVNIHEKYLEEIRSPSWETFEKKHKK